MVMGVVEKLCVSSLEAAGRSIAPDLGPRKPTQAPRKGPRKPPVAHRGVRHALSWRRRAPAKNETLAHASPREPHARDRASHGNGHFWSHRMRNDAHMNLMRY